MTSFGAEVVASQKQVKEIRSCVDTCSCCLYQMDILSGFTYCGPSSDSEIVPLNSFSSGYATVVPKK